MERCSRRLGDLFRNGTLLYDGNGFSLNDHGRLRRYDWNFVVWVKNIRQLVKEYPESFRVFLYCFLDGCFDFYANGVYRMRGTDSKILEQLNKVIIIYIELLYERLLFDEKIPYVLDEQFVQDLCAEIAKKDGSSLDSIDCNAVESFLRRISSSGVQGFKNDRNLGARHN